MNCSSKKFPSQSIIITNVKGEKNPANVWRKKTLHTGKVSKKRLLLVSKEGFGWSHVRNQLRWEFAWNYVYNEFHWEFGQLEWESTVLDCPMPNHQVYVDLLWLNEPEKGGGQYWYQVLKVSGTICSSKFMGSGDSCVIWTYCHVLFGICRGWQFSWKGFKDMETFLCPFSANCSSQPSMVHWLRSSIFPCLFVRPAMVKSDQISIFFNMCRHASHVLTQFHLKPSSTKL